MNRSDHIQEDLEKAARRARRMADRAEKRAERKIRRAAEAAERARNLADRASTRRQSRGESSLDVSIELLVEDVADRWSRKAEKIVEQVRDQLRGDDDDRYNASESETQRRPSRPSYRRPTRRTRVRSLRRRLRNGRQLYKDEKAGKVCGVCAGIAQYYDMETWQVRCIALLGLVFIPSVTVTGYFIAYFLMDKKPYYKQMTEQYGTPQADSLASSIDELRTGRTPRGRRQGRSFADHKMSNNQALKTARSKFNDLEHRLRSMEHHVTDSSFELQRELRKIAGDD